MCCAELNTDIALAHKRLEGLQLALHEFTGHWSAVKKVQPGRFSGLMRAGLPAGWPRRQRSFRWHLTSRYTQPPPSKTKAPDEAHHAILLGFAIGISAHRIGRHLPTQSHAIPQHPPPRRGCRPGIAEG